MTVGYHYGEYSAPWDCVDCGDLATAYIHGEGSYCPDHHSLAPPERAENGGSLDE